MSDTPKSELEQFRAKAHAAIELEARVKELEVEHEELAKGYSDYSFKAEMRILELEEENAELGSSRFNAEVREQQSQTRIAKALEILSAPGMWSDFAARAKAALRGE